MNTRRWIRLVCLATVLVLVAPVSGQAATKAPKAGDRCAPKEVGKTVAAAKGGKVTCVLVVANKRRPEGRLRPVFDNLVEKLRAGADAPVAVAGEA